VQMQLKQRHPQNTNADMSCIATAGNSFASKCCTSHQSDGSNINARHVLFSLLSCPMCMLHHTSYMVFNYSFTTTQNQSQMSQAPTQAMPA